MIWKNIKQNKGAAMMVLVIFMLFISLTIIIGIVTPVVREFQLAHDSFDSKQTYFTAESGVEDAMYRVKNSVTISSSESLVLGTSSTTTTITDLGSGQKEITALGTTESHQRKVDLVLTTGDGVAFNYGVQVGQGGISLSGSAGITGNVYANGPITGSSSSFITGSAVSANSPALAADQANGSGTPTYDLVFGNANATQDVAQEFQVSSATPVNKVQFYIKKVSTPSNANVYIVADSPGNPSTSVLASGTLSASAVSTTYGWVDVAFTSNPPLTVGTNYWLVIDGGVSSSKYYTIGGNNNGYANGSAKIGQYGTSWSATSPSTMDLFFNLFLGGVYGSITGSSGSQYNQLPVGTVGTGIAKAHTVNYTTASGVIYCQSGTGDNKSCDTSQADPTYQAFPVSNGNITDWENEAVAGGTVAGYSLSGSSTASLGPKEIIGNLTVSGSAVLTVSGTLWVTGNINISGAGIVKLASGYGSNSGVIITNGTITIAGSSPVQGSGTTGSYIMLLTTSDCPISSSCGGANAIDVSGAAGAVILYGPNGTANLSGSASAKEISAYSMIASGGATVNYQSGLASTVFSGGPSGSWTVSTWKETQ